MEDLYSSLTTDLAAYVSAATGTAVKPGDFRLPREEGQLSLGVFVRGDAGTVAEKLRETLPACPQVRDVREKNGWLLFYLSDAWFDKLIAWAAALDTRPAGSYVENRMAILARKGMAPCPNEEHVRRALWTAYLAFRRGAWREADEQLILTMTHEAMGGDRIALENRCGGVAAAILKFKGKE